VQQVSDKRNLKIAVCGKTWFGSIKKSGTEKTANLRWFGNLAFNKWCRAVNK
jgi:hypothetical protein